MSAKWQKWMPLYIDRFLGSPDVQMMEAPEFKGYLCLLLAAWQTDDCTLPFDHEELARISRLGKRLWKKHSDHILRKFAMTNGRLRNEVEYEEWIKAQRTFEGNYEASEELKRKRSEAGKKGNQSRWSDRNLSQVRSQTIANESQVRSQPIAKPIASAITNGSQNIALTGTVTGTGTGTGGTPPLPPEPSHDFTADPEDTIPDGLSRGQYANFVLDGVGIAASFGLQAKMGNAIAILAKEETCGIPVATKRMLDRMREAAAAGPVKWNFWLEDGRWKQTKPVGVSTEGWE